MAQDPPRGHVHSIQVSAGGVPKRPVSEALVDRNGLEGDTQRDRRHHGGPERAVCLLGLEIIARLQSEGHPIRPGSTGENLTLAGVPWSAVLPGCRLAFEGGLVLEAVSFAVPCRTIRGAFLEGAFERLSAERHPGEARIYARVLQPGRVLRGERFRLRPPAPDGR